MCVLGFMLKKNPAILWERMMSPSSSHCLPGWAAASYNCAKINIFPTVSSADMKWMCASRRSIIVNGCLCLCVLVHFCKTICDYSNHKFLSYIFIFLLSPVAYKSSPKQPYLKNHRLQYRVCLPLKNTGSKLKGPSFCHSLNFLHRQKEQLDNKY